MHRLAVVIATWFGTGLVPPVLLKGMAGTYGSFFALPLCWAQGEYCFRSPQSGVRAYFVVFVTVLAAGLWCVPVAEAALGARTDWKGKTRTRDQNQIVIDEVWGMLVACYPIAVMHPRHALLAYLLAFGLFRLFDTAKPWPIGYFDRMKSATGVMMDDLLAGAWAAAGVTVFATIFR